ncbi:type II toxin-antitoxin system RelE/ParE family toxin [Nitrosospira sp. Nsp1]|uniref:type II toxin-antitoxin system RelE/ParE family toxin n=1 Tax=Nitrosospira sp. Nsp1 TaxID=136547 RepID=UPI000883B2C4|nr:type II toxin-antitoxin system RelE/ParE family toxin [Nitrosospira sp. Nsp1]SCX54263.1 proteic killer suppression protein [Nitrosospira sp. Nsp1]
MMLSFKDKETEEFWLTGKNRKLPATLKKRAYARLQALHAAEDIKDLLVPPGNQLEKLKGERKAEHSIRINKQWRICFIWRDGDAHDVKIEDYH